MLCFLFECFKNIKGFYCDTEADFKELCVELKEVGAK